MKHVLAMIIFALAAFQQAAPVWADDDPSCRAAGPGASFCTEGLFARLDKGGTKGLSYWLDSRGYMAKVMVQSGPTEAADQAQIEAQIMAMVSRQASEIGREFEFSDLTSANAGEAPFGTLSYTLAGASQNQPILHSYIAIKGVVVQVISQIALKGAKRDADALLLAHHRALEAIHLTSSDPQI
ncbi:hypothetical protein SAMN04488523_104265 [Sulfitobacter brevis]|uniref:DUF1795 domain-containing protein n=1 Tax=Sulfitobacter brevis TaxID=74348 RepID=A0A1I1XCJ9_9RHOB|nr:hypothetical protein [Sulfitobacter brevis]SFE03090.1 hypothetical protein SAMN04488523_104265 [Sulfitobacter brevis]